MAEPEDDLPPDDEPDIAWGPSRIRLDIQPDATEVDEDNQDLSPLSQLVQSIQRCLGKPRD